MADWIKMSSNLGTNPKVMALADLLGVDDFHVIGMLWKVWAWADQHFISGNAVTVTAVRIDKLVRFEGFADALRKIGWLEGRDGALTFPRFAEHNGQVAKDRALTSKRVAKSRNADTVTNVTLAPLQVKRSGNAGAEAPLPLSPFLPRTPTFPHAPTPTSGAGARERSRA